ncbi:response regulator [Corallincola platygyrae]|uniref:histidine kinase n=1 Tax=Corallincola platygyrae TaxID=1193278 RepID=A0ABW4XLL6_9GAMM
MTHKLLRLFGSIFGICFWLFSGLAHAQMDYETLPAQMQAWASENPEVFVVADPNLPPYDFIDENGQRSGLGKELVDALNQVLPFTLTYKEYDSFSQGLRAVENGDAHVFSLCARTRHRAKHFHFSNPILGIESVIIFKASAEKLNQPEDLSPSHTVGFVKGYANAELVFATQGAPQSVMTGSVQEGLHKVANGEIDGFIIDPVQAAYWRQEKQLSDLAYFYLPNLRSLRLRFCVNRDHPELEQWIDWGMNQVGKGFISELHQQWAKQDAAAMEVEQREDHPLVGWITQIAGLSAALIMVLFFFYFVRGQGDELAKQFGSEQFRRSFLLGVGLLCLILVLLVGVVLSRTYNNTLNGNIKTLNISLATAEQQLANWYQGRVDMVTEVSQNPAVKDLAWVLVERDKADLDPRGSAELRAFKVALREASNLNVAAVRFYLISPDGINLASHADHVIGKPNLMAEQVPDLFQRVVAGETLFIPPIWSDFDLDGNIAEDDKDPVLLIATPMYDRQQRRIGVLAGVADPSEEFSQILSNIRLGDSGEIYAVDHRGFMVSESSFTHILRKQGRLKVGESVIGNIKLEDAMANQGIMSPFDGASNKRGGKNLSGYNDYQGHEVIGQWIWHPFLNLLLVGEFHKDEAMEDFRKVAVNLAVLTLISIAVIISVSMFMLVIGRRAYQAQADSAKRLEVEVEARTKELRKSEQDNRLILGSVGEGIIGFNGAQLCTFINPAACDMLLHSPDVIGSHARSVLPISFDNDMDVERAINEVMSSGNPLQVEEATLERPSAPYLPVEINIHPLTIDDAIQGVVVAFRDITEQNKAKLALIEAKQLADDASSAKSNFLANMSHEIRTPMNAIIGMSYLALQSELPDKPKNYVEKVNRSATNLLGIINDILDFSKIEAGHIDLERVDFNLADLLENVFTVISVKVEEKELELNLDIGRDVPLNLIGDPLRLNQVVTNLLSNAVKFTAFGAVSLEISQLNRMGSTVELRFCVRDTGIGMTEEQKAKLFQSFAQADASTTRKFGGTGLGLAISKSLVELMDGEIWVESTPDVGSEFFFTMQASVNETLEYEHQESRKALLKEKRVLVVDDDSAAIQVLKEILTEYGCEIYTANSGPEALEMATSYNVSFDIALIDWEMPKMNGLALCDELKALPNQDMKHLVMVSSHDSDEIGEENIRRRFDSMIAKPVNPDSVFRALKRVIDEQYHLQRRQYKRKARQGKRSMLTGAYLLLVEDNELNQELAKELLEQASIKVDVANNGQEAVNMVNAQQYDGVLMDVQMPVMDGYTATREIRENHPDLPIVAMTANAMAGDKEKVLEAGMNDHIAKPIDIEQMFDTLSQWITPSGLVTEIPLVSDDSEQEEDVSSLELSADIIDTEAGIAVCNGNQGLYLRLLKKFQKGQRQFVDEFNHAWQEGDWEAATRAAHTLKGAASHIGAKTLAASAGGVELACSEQQDEASINKLMELLKQHLDEVIHCLDRAFSQEQQSTATSMQESISKEQLIEALTELKELADNYDFEAGERASELKKQCHDPKLQALLDQLLQQLEEYDFDVAGQTLVSLFEHAEAMS